MSEYGAHDKAKTDELGEKFVPMTLCLPQIPHWLAWDRTQVPALTAWAMVRPVPLSYMHLGQRTKSWHDSHAGITYDETGNVYYC